MRFISPEEFRILLANRASNYHIEPPLSNRFCFFSNAAADDCLNDDLRNASDEWEHNGRIILVPKATKQTTALQLTTCPQCGYATNSTGQCVFVSSDGTHEPIERDLTNLEEVGE